MSQPSSSSSIRSLFDAALQDYAAQTGTKLRDHPLAKELQNCDSLDSISSVLQKEAQRFHEFRGDDGKIMKSLKSVVHVLYNFSTGSALGEGIGIVCPKSLLPISVSNMHSVAMVTCKGSICCFRRLARRRYLSPSPCICPCDI
jgi:fungal STAND N-terminal Goodbye domain